MCSTLKSAAEVLKYLGSAAAIADGRLEVRAVSLCLDCNAAMESDWCMLRAVAAQLAPGMIDHVVLYGTEEAAAAISGSLLPLRSKSTKLVRAVDRLSVVTELPGLLNPARVPAEAVDAAVLSTGAAGSQWTPTGPLQCQQFRFEGVLDPAKLVEELTSAASELQPSMPPLEEAPEQASWDA